MFIEPSDLVYNHISVSSIALVLGYENFVQCAISYLSLAFGWRYSSPNFLAEKMS